MTSEGREVEAHDSGPNYLYVFLILALFTAMEIGLAFLTDLPDGLTLGLLIFLAATKVGLVVLYFMHLKFDHRLFVLPFALAAVIAVPLLVIVVASPPEDLEGEESPLLGAQVPGGPQATEGVGGLDLPGEQVMQEKCSICHGLDTVEQASYDRQGWVSTVDRMISYGCPLNGQERDAVVEYLAAREDAAGTAAGGSGPASPQGSTVEPPEPGAEVPAVGVSSVTVTQDSFSIELSPASVPAGSVTFYITNAAEDREHDLLVIRSDEPAAELPTNDRGGVLFGEVEVMGGSGSIPPGGTAELSLELEPGHYALISSEPDSYAEGMYADLTVE